MIIGPGRLGMLVASGFKKLFPETSIYLKFRSENQERTKNLESEGYKVLFDSNSEGLQVENIVFCAPPTGNEHYAQDVENGFKFLKPGGLFVFTSSGSVMAQNSGGTVNEESERARNERSGKLMDAEDIVLSKGGCVMRLGGLYSIESGAHNFYARGGEFNMKPDGFINLLHYEDAAEACLQAFKCQDKVRGQLYLVADGIPMSRLQILEATRQCSLFSGMAEVKFIGGEGVDGKKYDVSKLKSLGWTPKYPSFGQFMEQN